LGNVFKYLFVFINMKKGVILLLFLVISMPISYAKVIDIPGIAPGETEIQEPLRDGSGVKRFIYAGSSMVASVKDSEIKYYHQGRMSNRVTTDSSGDLDKEFKSLPFGQKIENSGVDYPFTGKEEDESGLYYFGARYYDDNLGRFTGVDPVKENQPYTYVRNNPMNSFDPDGREIKFHGKYVVDYLRGEDGYLQMYMPTTDAPWYHVHEQLATAWFGLAAAADNLAVAALALPDNLLSVAMPEELDREAFWVSTMMVTWEYQGYLRFMTSRSAMAPVHAVHANRVDRAMARLGFGNVGHDQSKTELGFKLIDEAAGYINRYSSVRNFFGKARIPGRWFQAYHSAREGHHLPAFLMEAAESGELSLAARQRFAAEATIDVLEAAMSRGPGMSYKEASRIYRGGGWGGVYNRAARLTSQEYVDDILTQVPQLLAD
jgi:RHS repeat-associated protein